MKILGWVFCAIACIGFNMDVKAQEETQYLFGRGNVKIGGFGGPMVSFGGYDGQLAVYSGGGGAAIFNNTFFLGGYGTGLANDFSINTPTNGDASLDYELEFGHGGLWLGYNFYPKKVLHLTTSLQVGGGGISVYEIDATGDYDTFNSDAALVLIPTVGAELNVVSWMRFGVQAGYQYVTSNNTAMANNLSAPNAMLVFKFGYFGD